MSIMYVYMRLYKNVQRDIDGGRSGLGYGLRMLRAFGLGLAFEPRGLWQ